MATLHLSPHQEYDLTKYMDQCDKMISAAMVKMSRWSLDGSPIGSDILDKLAAVHASIGHSVKGIKAGDIPFSEGGWDILNNLVELHDINSELDDVISAIPPPGMWKGKSTLWNKISSRIEVWRSKASASGQKVKAFFTAANLKLHEVCSDRFGDPPEPDEQPPEDPTDDDDDESMRRRRSRLSSRLSSRAAELGSLEGFDGFRESSEESGSGEPSGGMGLESRISLEDWVARFLEFADERPDME